MQKLRIVYMGTPDFAVVPLKYLLRSGFNVVGVVTNPDKPSGRGQKLRSSALKKFAKKEGLPILEPLKFRSQNFLDSLKAWQADVQIVVAFKMLPEVVWSMPPLGTVNLHASLLPQYRGAAPINHAIINGETVTGVTTFLLQKEIDTGHILFQKEVLIDYDETAGRLHDKLMYAGAELLKETVFALSKGDYELKPQKDNENLKLAPKIFKKDCKINWRDKGIKIFKFICGLSPYPTAYTVLNAGSEEITLKVYECSYIEEPNNHSIGAVVSDNKTYFKVAVEEGYIYIDKLQQSGRRAMDIGDFLKGFVVSDCMFVS